MINLSNIKIDFPECRESNPELLGEKQDCFLCTVNLSYFFSFHLIKQLERTFETEEAIEKQVVLLPENPELSVSIFCKHTARWQHLFGWIYHTMAQPVSLLAQEAMMMFGDGAQN